MLLSLTTLAQRAISLSTKRPKASGEDNRLSRPCSDRLCLTVGSCSASTMAACIRAMIAGGVFAGASKPHQASASKPAIRSSLTVGTSGNCAARFADVTASAVSLPALTCGENSAIEAMASGLPLLPSDVGGLPEIAGENVVLKPRDTAAWSKAMAELWSHAEQRALLGEHSLAHARRLFNEKHFYNELSAVYRLAALA